MTAVTPEDARYLEGMKRLVDVVQQLSLARDLDTVMAIARHAARELTGADGATFILRDGDRCHYADEEAIAPLWKGQRFPMTACISGWAMIHGESVAIEDIYADDRIPHDAYRPTFVKSLAMVPIRSRDPIGAIGNYWAARHVPSKDELDLLRALADTTAVALENVRVFGELERRVADRTAELAAANRELESFSYSVSHDLQAPVRAIRGFSALLEEDHASQLDEEARRKLTVISGEAARMGELIQGLLDLSRLGRHAIEREDIDMVEAARRAFDRATSEGGAGVELRLGALPRATGDRRLVDRIWDNLLSNAIKFSARRPSPRVAVDGRRDGPFSVYTVEDNGAGFDPAAQAKLFGAFQRLHHASEFPGTGIGLALVRRIVERHGGHVDAEGRPGEGARFRFALPAAPHS
jgi:signal transduction histidine kinase